MNFGDVSCKSTLVESGMLSGLCNSSCLLHQVDQGRAFWQSEAACALCDTAIAQFDMFIVLFLPSASLPRLPVLQAHALKHSPLRL